MAKLSGKSWKEDDLFDAIPDFDPEDEDIENAREFFNSKHEREDGDDLTSEPSRLLAKNIALPSTKSGRYAGKTSSRSKLKEESSAEEEYSDDDAGDSEDNSDVEEGSDIGEDGSDLDMDDSESEDEEESDMDGSDDEDVDDDAASSPKSSSDAPFTAGGVQSVALLSSNDDVSKGEAVQMQLGLWESLLELRIQLQPVLLTSNRLPSYLKMPSYCQDAAHKNAVGAAKANVREMLSSMIEMQHQLLERNADTRHLAAIATTAKSSASDRRTALSREPQPSIVDSDEEIDSDMASGDDDDGNDDMMQMLDKGQLDESAGEEDDAGVAADESTPMHGARKRKRSGKPQTLKTSDDFEAVLSDFHHGFEKYRNQVLTKWSDRTRLGSGKLTKNAFKSGGDTSIVNAINQVLSDQDRLVKRTQLNRSNQLPIGEARPVGSNNEEASRDSHLKDINPEIFDDEDFYHQMLKEFIEGQTRVKDANDSVAMGRQWLQIQKLRRKVKKQVDTKASKGRKVRYDVHPKLANYTVSIPEPPLEDTTRNGILAVIFGKRRYGE